MENRVVDGIVFNSVREACKKYEVDYQKVLKRIKNGMSLEEAIKTKNRADFGNRSVEVDGNTFRSLHEACKYYNVNYHTVSGKVRCGISVEDAIKGTRQIRKRREIIVDGIRYATIKDVCVVYGAHYPTVVTRIHNGKTVEEAVKCKSDGRLKPCSVKGKDFRSIAEACRYYNVDYGYVRYQMRKGLDIEESIRVVKSKESLFRI